jgi:hypothetical protein
MKALPGIKVKYKKKALKRGPFLFQLEHVLIYPCSGSGVEQERLFAVTGHLR